MAQTGFTPIQIYSSSTASAAPVAGSLTNSTLGSELAINITDGKLFYKDNSGGVQVIAWKVTPATAGGTGLTTYAAGDLLYASGASTLARLATGSGVLVGGAPPTYSTNPNIDIQGNAATATQVKTIATATNATFYPTFVDSDNVTLNAESIYTDAGMTYNPSTNLLTVTELTVTNTATASISGNAGSATNTAITNDTTTNATMYPTWVTANTGNLPQKVTSTKLVFNPSNGYLGASGIQFNGDTAAANALDDYEEGTWDVQLFDASSGGNQSATTVTGYYTKIGNFVSCSFRNLNNISTAGMTAGNQLYFSLPFSIASTLGSGIGTCTTEVFAFGVNLTQINPFAEAGATRGRFVTTGSGVANAFLTVATITTGVSDIEYLTISYFTA
jgi:hypothetical protein